MAYSTEVKDKAIAMIGEGMSLEKIRSELGISRSTYYLWRQPPKPRPAYVRPEPRKGMHGHQKHYLLLGLLSRDLSEQAAEFWTWRSVKQRAPAGLSRQSVIRLLKDYNIHPGDTPPFPYTRHKDSKMYLLERSNWTRPAWLKEDELPRKNSILWRLWGRRRDLSFAFSSDSAPTAMRNMLCAASQQKHIVILASPEIAEAFEMVRVDSNKTVVLVIPPREG